ncbi:MAG: DUF4423 domain-containing protein [Myxococcota bacterium]
MELDYEAVSRDLVRSLRGERSQTAFARRLGYRSNAVYTWESGRRWPTASVFLWAASRVGVDVDAALRGFLRDATFLDGVDPTSPAGVAAMLSDLRGDAPVGAVAARAGRSRFAVSRWLKGQSEPRLPDLLRMIDATSLRLLDFVARFADPGALPSTGEAWTRLQAARALAWSSPWAQVVLLALELEPYRALPAHDSGWLAARIGIPAAEVDVSLTALVHAGQVVFGDGRFAPVSVSAVDVRGSTRDLKRFWVETSLQKLVADAPGMWSYNVFAVSETDLHRLEEMQRAHYRAIRSLVAESAPAERVVLVHLQTIPLV